MAHASCRNLFGFAVTCTLMALVGAGAGSAGETAGPPMICVPIKIGEDKTLPNPPEQPSGYARDKLVSETLALLGPRTSILTRMETIRRALVLGASDPGTLSNLLCRLQARVLDLEARGKGDALAWFDAGYMAGAWSELDPEKAPDVGLAEGSAGYAWLKKALALGRHEPAMEFAAALAVHPAMHKGTYDLYKAHLAKAAAGAEKGSLLEQNLIEHCLNWKESYEDLKKGGPEHDGGRDR